LASEDDIRTLEMALVDAYNQVTLCDQDGAFIRADMVNIDTDAVDAFGDDIDTGNESSLPFTWLVEFEGECLGCTSETSLFGPSESGSAPSDGTCSCDFPTVEAYVLACNAILSTTTTTGGSFELLRATVLVTQGGGTPLPSTSFTSRVFVDGNGILFDASTSDLTLFGQAFCETYNSLNALNFRICDTNEREITAVAATVQEADDDGTVSPPFSVVFHIVGSCRGCGQATVVFGNHAEASPVDTTATCPAGAVFRCPSEEEFQVALQDTIDRLQQEGELTIIDTISDVDQEDAPRPTVSSRPSVSPTRSPS
jgi:Fe-S cluster biogenesis protein NfuA